MQEEIWTKGDPVVSKDEIWALTFPSFCLLSKTFASSPLNPSPSPTFGDGGQIRGHEVLVGKEEQAREAKDGHHVPRPPARIHKHASMMRLLR